MPWKFENDGMLRQKGRLLQFGYRIDDSDTGTNDNISSLLFAGGFNFFHSSLLDVCPYDHKLHGLFFGEEISMAVRLFTHGYDLYSPPETVCYHQWKRNPLRDRDTSRMSEDEQILFESKRHASKTVVKMQLQGLGRGLGAIRSAAEFSAHLGVDFKECRLSKGCEDGNLPSDAFVSSFLTGTEKESFNCNEMSNIKALVGQFIS